ncbi:hypothetical protein [Fimbriiglobus ruber]|uniref:CRISPR repeat RNA endoribonuclease Cas6 n=1 Tax=Fimbriiglobus ruber TaxID=1908690 RepID=A0A225DR92_9BACT|nr:hypothetical protein [Fimbriiglobus ruber]OWK41138.1 CRISPR repeat RNA endoribonuclease Cas6 [Fimbriiglobus ruber]
MTLFVRETRQTLRVARGGRALAWIGPALRGLAGGRLRAHVCRLPVAEQMTRWRTCAGCPAMSGCAYGETYEPDPPAGVVLAPGWENTTRPIVIAPQFPVPEWLTPGVAFDVSIIAIGRTAAAHVDDVWEALRIGGADLAIGLGDDRILFDLEPGGGNADRELTLPPGPGDEPPVPLVRVDLTSPLFLNETGADDHRRPVLRPTLAQLLRATLRTLGPLHRLYADPLPDAVFGAVKAAAAEVPTIRAEFHEFRQGRFSNRTKDRYEMVGAVGWAEYGPVPAWLVPWLEAGGRVFVGTHRIAGAGGWTVRPNAQREGER